MAKMRDDEQTRLIGKNIGRLLFDHEMTQLDLAKILGVSETAVNNWVTGRNAPNMGNIQRVADHFRVSMYDILEERRVPQDYQRAWLMDKIAKATPEQVQKMKKLWDLVDDEEERNG